MLIHLLPILAPFPGSSLALFINDGGLSQGILREDGWLCSWDGLDRMVVDRAKRCLREREH